MYKLFIDGSFNFLELVLFKNNVKIDHYFEKLNKNFTNIFNDAVDLILKKNNISYKNISQLYIINGPGSFTSIKLVVLFANTLKLIFPNCELYYINSIKWNATSAKELCVIDAKSDLYYVSTSYFKKPFLIKKETEPKINKSYFRYFYDNELKKDFDLKWRYHAKNFEKTNIIKPLYIKPAIYDNNKR